MRQRIRSQNRTTFGFWKKFDGRQRRAFCACLKGRSKMPCCSFGNAARLAKSSHCKRDGDRYRTGQQGNVFSLPLLTLYGRWIERFMEP
jgi:hypothetical protein